jgi:hypothetical protein
VEGKKSTLESLLVSQESIATGALARALGGLISIVRESGEILPTPEFNKLDTGRKILTYLLGLRARALLEVGEKRVAADAEEIADFVGISGQRAREYLSRLKGTFLQKSADGWQLPSIRISAACEQITSKR